MLRAPPKSNRPTKKAKATTNQVNTYSLTRPVRVRAGNQGFAKQHQCTLTYSTWCTILCSTGAYAQYIFSCNGLYDPDHTGTGHQPLYFDQLLNIYNYYTVLSSKISVSIVSPPGASMGVVLFKDDDTTTGVTDCSQALERKGCVYRACESTSFPGSGTLRNSWRANATFPGDPTSRAEFQGSNISNPTEQTFFVIGAENRNLETTSYTFLVKIEYNTVFDELRSITPS